MKKWTIGLLCLCLLAGCTQNKIKVVNRAGSNVIFNFRATHYEMAPTDEIILKDVPYNSYLYSTIYTVPPGAKKVAPGSGLSGTLKFDSDNTSYELIYTSALLDSVYNIDASVSTNDPIIETPTASE